MIEQKIKSRQELAAICEKLKNHGKKIGFTSGAFDLTHAGHVDYLERAKSSVDILIVGINSDQSVKKYKGSNRPIISEKYRLRVIAALESVDYVFLFDERRNEQNINILKPDFYIKAGDYSSNQLTSKSVIEKIGGEAKIIPVNNNISTTQIIEKICSISDSNTIYKEDIPDVGHFELKSLKSNPVIFLDRDGTINKDIGYLSEIQKFEFMPNSIEGLKKMQDMGYKLMIITNQAGIGLGYFTKEDFYKFNLEMLKKVSSAGIVIDKIYFCPHSFAENCSCRKPDIGLIKRAKQDANIDIPNSYFIGDRETDIQTGKNAGTKTILIRNERISDINNLQFKADYVADDLLDAANYILEQERK